MNKNIDKEELELGQRIFQSALRVNSALTEISIILHNKEQIYTDSYYNVISEIRAFNDTFFKINNNFGLNSMKRLRFCQST
ncbi:hypothetical protein C6H68_22075 [Photorhabdus luminescens]|nr:hypothetical protein C6H68_22075 [Photorhabdus luminescens]